MKNEVLQIVLTMRQSMKPGNKGNRKTCFLFIKYRKQRHTGLIYPVLLMVFLLTRMVECNSVIGV